MSVRNLFDKGEASEKSDKQSEKVRFKLNINKDKDILRVQKLLEN